MKKKKPQAMGSGWKAQSWQKDMRSKEMRDFKKNQDARLAAQGIFPTKPSKKRR